MAGRPKTKIDIKEVGRLMSSPFPYSEVDVAATLGITRQTLARLLKDYDKTVTFTKKAKGNHKQPS